MKAIEEPFRLRRVATLVNPASGSVGPSALDDMAALCRELGLVAEAVPLGEGVNEACARLPQGVDGVFVLGGDGTARAVAERLGPDGPPVAPLPGGTMNLLPKALYGDRPWRECVRMLAAGARPDDLPGAKVGEHTFFIAGIFGAAAWMARAREELRAGRLLVALRRVRRAAQRAFGPRLRVLPEGRAALKIEALGVLCPVIGEADGSLEWAALDPRDAFEAARLSFGAMTGQWRNDPRAATTSARRGRLISARAIPAILDGEPTLLPHDVQIRFEPRAARILAFSAESPP